MEHSISSAYRGEPRIYCEEEKNDLFHGELYHDCAFSGWNYTGDGTGYGERLVYGTGSGNGYGSGYGFSDGDGTGIDPDHDNDIEGDGKGEGF